MKFLDKLDHLSYEQKLISGIKLFTVEVKLNKNIIFSICSKITYIWNNKQKIILALCKLLFKCCKMLRLLAVILLLKLDLKHFVKLKQKKQKKTITTNIQTNLTFNKCLLNFIKYYLSCNFVLKLCFNWSLKIAKKSRFQTSRNIITYLS